MQMSSSDVKNLPVEEDDLRSVTDDLISIIEDEENWPKDFVKQQLRKFPYDVRRFLSHLSQE